MAALTNEQKYVILIRLYLNDNEQLNRLIRDEESTDEKIQLAIAMVLSDWQVGDPYQRTWTCDTFPSMSLLIKGAAIELLTSAGIYHSRNRLSYTAGGLSVEIHNKAPEYMQWIDRLKRDYETEKLKYMRILNTEAAWSGGAAGLHSDYILAGLGTMLEAYV
jgi:hypothetical protein